ncbi:hypothetical protein BSKO_10631 [Bryopsis sp. KO-2023]|nr:hypothetical protein BSKO_10631 [Bryopsis sp. KO-2023]
MLIACDAPKDIRSTPRSLTRRTSCKNEPPKVRCPSAEVLQPTRRLRSRRQKAISKQRVAPREIYPPLRLSTPRAFSIAGRTRAFLVACSLLALAFRSPGRDIWKKSVGIFGNSKRRGADEKDSETSDAYRGMFPAFRGLERRSSHIEVFGGYQSLNGDFRPTTPSWLRRFTRSTCEDDGIDKQVTAVKELMLRRVPELVGKVGFSRKVRCNGDSGCFEMTIEKDILCIRGSSGVELASGLHWFLKNECNGLITWDKTGGKQLNGRCLDAHHMEVVRSKPPMHHDRQTPLSYYQNVVTSSYSMAFWDWKRWEAELDWMALHGVNLALALSGQEFIWVKVFEEMGLDRDDLSDFFAGPAFLSWGRMGNIQGYMGPLPRSYIDGQAALQRKIVNRMRVFGITPVFPGFAGFLPRKFLELYPAAQVVKSKNWCNFPEHFSCVFLLDPHDSLFEKIGTMFVEKMRFEFGHDKVGYYAVDTFNEMEPTRSDPAYLQSTSTAVFNALQKGDSSAVWLMQAWLFYSDRQFWNPPQIQGVLKGVPQGHLLLLDLFAEQYPQWKSTNSFYGRPFIWCMLHNFGGNHDMHGPAPQVAQGPPDAIASDSSIVGVGMTPEGLEHNPVMFELMSEMAFREKAPDLESWFRQYSVQRYGGLKCPNSSAAWEALRNSVYGESPNRHETVMDIPVSRPGLEPREVFWGLKAQMWYDHEQVVDAWGYLLDCGDALGQSSAFQYDLVDVGRQVLSKLGTKYWHSVTAAYRQKDKNQLEIAGTALLGLLSDMDRLLSTHVGFLLGPWLESSKSWAKNDQEKISMERNARMQITLWGISPSGDTDLSDYANKQWGGLMSSFYRERWRMWLVRLMKDLTENRDYDKQQWTSEAVSFTIHWTQQTEAFPTEPSGDLLQISKELFGKYSAYARIADA